MKAADGAFAACLAALWLALFGLAALVLHFAVVEVLCIEIAGVVLALLALGLMLRDRRPVSCDHEPDCGDTR